MNIYQKLIEVRKTVPSIKKDAYNPHFKFEYVSSSALINTLRAEMDKYSLLLIPNIVKKEVIAPEGKQILTLLDIEFTWLDADHPNETVKCMWHGQGLDSGEKGVGKALTYAEKYFLLKFFNIPSDVDDPDAKKGEQERKDKVKPPDKGKQEDKSKPAGGNGDHPKLQGDVTDAQADIIIGQVIGSHLVNNFERFRLAQELFGGMTKQRASEIIEGWTKEKTGMRETRKAMEKQYGDEGKKFDDWLAEKYQSDQKSHPQELQDYSNYCKMPEDVKPFDIMHKDILLQQFKKQMETIKEMARDDKEKNP